MSVGRMPCSKGSDRVLLGQNLVTSDRSLEVESRWGLIVEAGDLEIFNEAILSSKS